MQTNAKVDIGRDEGVIPELIINGGGLPKENWKAIKKIRQNANVPSATGTWEQVDEEVIRAYEEEAFFIEDLRSMGLTVNHDLGNLFSSYRVTDLMTDAQADMSGVPQGDKDRIDYNMRAVPVPVIHKEFEMGWRESANTDTSADNISEATRAVARKLEDIAWNGVDWKVEGNALNGINDQTSAPAEGAWGGTGAWTTGSNAYSEVKSALSEMQKTYGYSGPFNLYVDYDYMAGLYDLRANTSSEYLELIERLPGINEVVFTSKISNNKAALVSMTRESVDLAVSQWISPVNWSTGPNGRVTQYQVFAVAVPRLKYRADGNYGVYLNSDIS